jgi:uncharacterized damage-inducible protein DinB
MGVHVDGGAVADTEGNGFTSEPDCHVLRHNVAFTTEAWLRGPVEGIPALLQPIAHALQQAREETRALLQDFPAELLWNRPAGLASVGFHLLHISGVVDRLFTYARGELLSGGQRQALEAEEHPPTTSRNVDDLLCAFDAQVERALHQLRSIDVQTLTDPRTVGRKQLPSTVLGLLFHAAEHVQRHVGQLLVTARVQLWLRQQTSANSDPG